MHAAFATVIWVVCGFGLLAAFAALIFSGRTWEEYGKDHLLMDGDQDSGPKPGSAAAMLERDIEIRQLLEARNARRIRRGEQPLDVERELARLTAPQIDPELRSEIRDLVVARNHRRARTGKPPLDVQADIERELEELIIRPGTYFNPQTEVLIVVDDSPELDAEIFNMEEYEGADWVLIADEVPVDENRRDELLETFQVHYHPGTIVDDDGEADDELEEDDQDVGRE